MFIQKNLNEKENIELNEINKKLKIFLVDDHFDFELKNYIFYKNLFMKKIRKKKKLEENGGFHQLLKEKLKNIYHDYIDLKEFENYIKREERKEEELSVFMKKIHKTLEYNYKLFKPDELIKKMEGIRPLLYTLLHISKINEKDEAESCSYKIWKSFLRESKDYINFFSLKKLTFRLIFLGKQSSGKTSILNSIIGYNLNILDTNLGGCTKNAFIIKYCKDIKNISIFECKIKEDFKGIYITEELEKIGEGKDNVKEIIKKLNDNKKSEDLNLNYYIIKTPIEALDNNKNIEEEIKYQLEFIDLPGIDISPHNFELIFKQKIMEFSSKIIYVNTGVLEDQINLNLIDLIIKKKLFNSTFFINTFFKNSDSTIDTLYSLLNKIIEKKYKNQHFIDIVKNNIPQVNKKMISKFSFIIYKKYQQNMQEFKEFNFQYNNLEELCEHLQKKIIRIDGQKFKDFKPEERQLMQIKQKLESIYEISDNQTNLMENICKLYLFINENFEEHHEFKKSFAKDFFGKFNTFIDREKINYYKILNVDLYYNFIIKILKRMQEIKKCKFNKEPKLLPINEIDNRKGKLLIYQFDLMGIIQKKIQDFKKWNKENVINPLEKLCGTQEFDIKYKEFDEKCKEKYNELEKNLENEWKSFQTNCFKEVEKFRKEAIGDSFENYITYLSKINNEYETGKKLALVFSSGMVGGAILGLIFSASIACPILVLLSGGIAFLSIILQSKETKHK